MVFAIFVANFVKRENLHKLILLRFNWKMMALFLSLDDIQKMISRKKKREGGNPDKKSEGVNDDIHRGSGGIRIYGFMCTHHCLQVRLDPHLHPDAVFCLSPLFVSHVDKYVYRRDPKKKNRSSKSAKNS